MATKHNPNRVPHEKLKEIRRVCGFTQVQFAKRVGVSTATIVAVEVGNLELSEKLAFRIAAVTDVHPYSLLYEGRLQFWDSSDFTVDGWREHKPDPTFFAGELSLHAGHKMNAAVTLGDVRSLLKAAAVGNKFPLACFLVREQMHKLIYELGLEDAFLTAAKQDDFLEVRSVIEPDLKRRIEKTIKRRPMKHLMRPEMKDGRLLGKSPKKPRQPSASPRPDSSKKVSASRTGGPSRKR